MDGGRGRGRGKGRGRGRGRGRSTDIVPTVREEEEDQEVLTVVLLCLEEEEEQEEEVLTLGYKEEEAVQGLSLVRKKIPTRGKIKGNTPLIMLERAKNQ